MTDPVFVDRTGRRRWLFTSLGAGLGVLLMAGCSLLIAGLLGSSPVPLPGLPAGGQGGVHHEDSGAGGSSPAPTGTRPEVPGQTRTGTSTTTAPAGGTTPAPTSTDVPGNRRTTHPVNPRPSRTK